MVYQRHAASHRQLELCEQVRDHRSSLKLAMDVAFHPHLLTDLAVWLSRCWRESLSGSKPWTLASSVSWKQASLGASPESTRAAPFVTHRDVSGAAQEPQAEQEMQEPELSQEEKAAERASVDTDIVHCIIEVQGPPSSLI